MALVKMSDVLLQLHERSVAQATGAGKGQALPADGASENQQQQQQPPTKGIQECFGLALVVGRGKGSGKGDGPTNKTKFKSTDAVLRRAVQTFLEQRLQPAVRVNAAKRNAGRLIVSGEDLAAWCAGPQAQDWARAASAM